LNQISSALARNILALLLVTFLPVLALAIHAAVDCHSTLGTSFEVLTRSLLVLATRMATLMDHRLGSLMTKASRLLGQCVSALD